METRAKFNYMNLLLILIFLVGMGVLLYPNISDYFNQKNSSKSISEYDETIAQLSEEKKHEILEQATYYNSQLINNSVGRFADMSDEMWEEYMSLLNVNGDGMMCYLKIDKLGVNLPVYHSTEEEVLQKYVGHIEGTSLPTGGIGTHCGLSGHRGLPSAVLFTNLDRLDIGDSFCIIVQGEEHYYQIDQILTVLPNDLSPLAIDPNEDYCTLVTCTPYGENTHRLMVRGVRVPDEEVEEVIAEIAEEKMGMTREQVVNIIAVAMGVIFLFVGIPLIIIPVVPKRVIYLRPWDDNLETVIASAITVSEAATKANWEVDEIRKYADRFAALRRWNPHLYNGERVDDADESRPWSDFDYYEEDPLMREPEDDDLRLWDDDVLEKVDQDWSVLDREQNKKSVLFTNLLEIIARGKVEEPPEDLTEFFEKEMDMGRYIQERSKQDIEVNSKR